MEKYEIIQITFNDYLLQWDDVQWFKREMSFKNWQEWGPEPGGPVVKTSPFNAGSVSPFPGRRAKIPHALWPKNQNIKQKQCCNKINKGFKNGPHQKKKILKKNTDMEKPWRHIAKWVGGAMVR